MKIIKKIIRPNTAFNLAAILVLASFTWDSISVGEYLEGGVSKFQIYFRVIPLILVTFFILRIDVKRKLIYARQLVKFPFNIFIIYIIIGGFAGLRSYLPLLSFWKMIEIFVVLYLVSVMFNTGYDNELSQSVVKRIFIFINIILIYFLIMVLIFPDKSIRGFVSGLPWIQGIFPRVNPNSLGTMSVYVIYSVLCGVQNLKNKFILLIMFSASVICFTLSMSRTAVVMIIMSLMLLGIVSLIKKNVKGVITFFILIILIYPACLLIYKNVIYRGTERIDIKKLSGRVTYWAVAKDGIDQYPLIGKGLGTGSRFLYELETPSRAWQKGSVNVHSSYYEMVLSSGFIGAIGIIILYLLYPIYGLIKIILLKGSNKYLLFYVGIGLIIILRAFTSIAPALFSIDFIISAISIAGINKELSRNIKSIKYHNKLVSLKKAFI